MVIVRLKMLSTVKFAFAVVLCGASVLGQRVCNNAADLCGRKYNSITHLGAHDSPFVRNRETGFTPFGDQYYDAVTALNAGVRLLQGQLHKDGDSWNLCHSTCILSNAGILPDWLGRVRGWLDSNPNEVVTLLLVNSDNADAQTLDSQFQAADIKKYAYTPPSTTSATNDWPTLDQMIDQNQRLVVFVASLPPSSDSVAPYLLDEFTHVFENNYDVTDPSKFDCAVNRPSNLANQDVHQVLDSGYMSLMNHMLYNKLESIEFPADDKVEHTNAASGQPGNLGDSLNACTTQYGRPPNFVLVDFFNIGTTVNTIDKVNGVQGKTSGRKSLPSTVAATVFDLLIH